MDELLRIEINGNRVEVEPNLLHDIVKTYLRIPHDNFKGLAVAVNSEIIPKSQWAEVNINEGDHIEIITATQGG